MWSAMPALPRHACKLGVEGIVSKRVDQPHLPGQQGLWLKSKCLIGEEFVVVAWTDFAGTYSSTSGRMAQLQSGPAIPRKSALHALSVTLAKAAVARPREQAAATLCDALPGGKRSDTA